MVRIASEKLMLIDHTYTCNNLSPLYSGVKQIMFLLAMAQMVIWIICKEEILQCERYSYQDLVRFFDYQLRLKIRSDRKHLVSSDFNERWVTGELDLYEQS